MGNTNPVTQQECDDARKQLADFACSFVGSHYLWGSCGDAPGNNINGSPYRPDATIMAKTSTDPKAVSIFAARCDAGGTGYTCAGSYRNVPGGGECNPRDLQEYLDGLKGPDGQFKDESQWGPNRDGLFPRLISKSSGNGKIVWGEDCRQKQHFDCIGFMNYVHIMKVQGFVNSPGGGQNDIGMWANGNAAGGQQCVIAKPPASDHHGAESDYAGVDESLLKPADVLCQRSFVPKMIPVMEPDKDGKMVPKKNPKTKQVVKVQATDAANQGIWQLSLHHIGMYAGGGLVIQANDSPMGVTLNKYAAKSWHYATRMPCSKLILKP